LHLQLHPAPRLVQFPRAKIDLEVVELKDPGSSSTLRHTNLSGCADYTTPSGTYGSSPACTLNVTAAET